MTTIHLIRHARPAAGWGQEADPGLDDTGHAQALATAQSLVRNLSPMPIYSSPLRRCLETAAPLNARWQASVEIVPAMAEIPPPPLPLKERSEWLAAAMRGTWAELQANAPANSPDYAQWRGTVVTTLLAMPTDCVIYTHFIAINVAVSAASNEESVITFRPDHASITTLSAVNGKLSVVELGRQADTSVLTR